MIRDGVLHGEVAEAARVLARLGLVTAFGHVSARAGDSMLITPAADLAGVTAGSVIEVPLAARDGLVIRTAMPIVGRNGMILPSVRLNASGLVPSRPSERLFELRSRPSLRLRN